MKCAIPSIRFRMSTCRWMLVPALLLVSFVLQERLSASEPVVPPESMLTREAVGAVQRRELMNLVRETLDATHEKRAPDYPDDLLRTYRPYRNGVQILLLHEGKILGSAWADDGSLLTNIRQAAGRAAYDAPETARNADILLALFLTPFNAMDVAPANALYPAVLGAEGYRVRFRNRTAFSPPLELALQRSDWRDILCDLAHNVTSPGGRGSTGNRPQLLKLTTEADFEVEVVPTLTLAARAGRDDVTPLYRLAPLVDDADVTKERIDVALALALEWYLENQREDGLFPILYDPVQDQPAGRDALLVQLWNVAALAHLWHYTGRPEARLLGMQALETLLERHYLESTDPDIGYIREGDTIRLAHSAAALAAIVLLEAGTGEEPFVRHATRLRATVGGLRFPDGRYATFLHPADRGGHETTDPGMAQYAMILDAMATGNGEQAEAGFQSFRFYSEFFRQERDGRQDPHTFVPWHAMANRQLYTATRRQELADFLFTSTLWGLGSAQQIAEERGLPLPLDERGRVYLPANRRRQPPQLSETGLFMIAAAEALSLSTALHGDGARDPDAVQRNDALRRHMLAGARYLLQMQYAGEFDLLLVREPKRARGGFRLHAGDQRISLEGVSMAVWGLCRIGEALTAGGN